MHQVVNFLLELITTVFIIYCKLLYFLNGIFELYKAIVLEFLQTCLDHLMNLITKLCYQEINTLFCLFIAVGIATQYLNKVFCI
jgi:hypothetical protein